MGDGKCAENLLMKKSLLPIHTLITFYIVSPHGVLALGNSMIFSDYFSEQIFAIILTSRLFIPSKTINTHTHTSTDDISETKYGIRRSRNNAQFPQTCVIYYPLCQLSRMGKKRKLFFITLCFQLPKKTMKMILLLLTNLHSSRNDDWMKLSECFFHALRRGLHWLTLRRTHSQAVLVREFKAEWRARSSVFSSAFTIVKLRLILEGFAYVKNLWHA